MYQYRLYVKSATSLNGRAIESVETKIIKATIKRDLTTKATSSIEVLGIPNALSNGDIVGIRNQKGETIYQGVVKSFDASSNTITCDQMIGLLDFNFLYKYADYNASDVETNMLQIINKVKESSALMNQALGSFNFSKSTTTSGKIVQKDDNTFETFNVMSKFIEFYNNYDVVLDLSIPFNQNQGVGAIKRFDKEIVNVIKDNTKAIRNVSVTKQEVDTNILHIINSVGNIVASYYVKNDGTIVTSDGYDDRPHLIKVKYVKTKETDQATINSIKAENLPDESLNHCITMELLTNSKVFDFANFELGTWFELWLQNKHYFSAFTGYNYTINNNGSIEKVTLTFGKVRQTLESRLFKNGS